MMDGAFDAVRQLVQWMGPDNTFIISKCMKVTEQKITGWLVAKDFYNHTSFNPVNVYFCRERAEKAPLAQQLGLTHFVDDRADILLSMHQIVSHRYLFGPQDQPMMFDDGLVRVLTWDETLAAIYQTL